MSIINDVLKKIDNKSDFRKLNRPQIPVHKKPVNSSGGSFSGRQFWGVFLAIVLFLLVGLGLFFWPSAPKKVEAVKKAEVVKSKPVTKATPVKQSVKPVRKVIAKPQPKKETTSVEKLYQQALSQSQNGQIALALTTLNRSEVIASNNEAAKHLLVVLLVQMKRYMPALEIVNMELRAAPSNMKYVLLKSQILDSLNQTDVALKLLSSYDPPLLGHLDYYAMMAKLNLQAKQYDTAIQLYEQLLDQQQNNGTWWLGLAVAFQNDQQNSMAVWAYQKALGVGTLKPQTVAFVNIQLGRLS